jgi:hypothetical protein
MKILKSVQDRYGKYTNCLKYAQIMRREYGNSSTGIDFEENMIHKLSTKQGREAIYEITRDYEALIKTYMKSGNYFGHTNGIEHMFTMIHDENLKMKK